MTSTLLYDQGPAASRPAAGIKGRIYNPTDESGVLYKDDGAGWVRVPWQAYNPLSIGWHTAFWAEDPNWTPPADGGAVSQWDDGSGNNHHATQATAVNQPLYRASVAELGGRPAIESDGVDDRLVTATFAELVYPYTQVLVARRISGAGGYFTSGTATWDWAGIAWNNRWETVVAGSIVCASATGYDTAAHLLVATFDGANSTLELDGTQIATGSASAGYGPTAIKLFCRQDNNFHGNTHMSFQGLLDGTLTQQQKDDLLDWSRSHYGTP